MASRVTVVIPVWDSYVDVVTDAVDSIRDGSDGPRVIVLDNASERRVSALEGCQLVRSEVRMSRGAIRNVGLSYVDTEFVAFLDADDLVLPEALPNLVARLERSPRAHAAVGRILEISGSPHRSPREVAGVLARAPRPFAWANAVWSLMPIQGCAVMRTAAVRDSGGYPDASSGEDWVLSVSLGFRGRVVFDPKPVLVYRLRPDSPGVGHTSWRLLLANAARVRERLRTDPAVMAGRIALAGVTIAQWLAVFAVRPAVRAGRSGARRSPRDWRARQVRPK